MAKVRVYELAKEFGVSSKVVLARLNDLGEFTRSASSTVEAAAVRRLAESFGSNPPARLRPAGPPRPSNDPFSSTASRRPPAAAAPPPLSRDEQLRREAALLFGKPVDDIKLAPPASPRRSPRPAPRVRQHDSWERNLIGPDAKRAWIRGGLGPDDGDRAWRCAAAGLGPYDLQLRVRGVRVGDRIRGGESIPSVPALVAEYKGNNGDAD